jgi:benzoyl-CoA reductase/2-hydroxyglutaryl-CoA dehydratase subunit BcrC/BadD/HgdB
MGIPQVILEKPTETGPRGRKLHRRYFLGFLRRLEEMIGEELDEERMREVLEEANRAAELYYELYDLKKFSPCPVPNIFSLFTYGTRFTRWGRPEGTEMMRAMVNLSRKRLEAGEYPASEEVARCIWLYIGYYFDFLGFFNWMEERGITYLNDVLSLCQPRFVDTSSRESMLEGLAETCFEYPMTRQMGSSSMSLTWIEDMCGFIRDLRADCAIYSGHHACKQTWSVINQVRQEIMKRTGAPVLCLQGDSWIRRMTPTSVLQEEIESFVANVVRRRSRRAGRSA